MGKLRKADAIKKLEGMTGDDGIMRTGGYNLWEVIQYPLMLDLSEQEQGGVRDRIIETLEGEGVSFGWNEGANASYFQIEMDTVRKMIEDLPEN